jgi:hypothetical protein
MRPFGISCRAIEEEALLMPSDSSRVIVKVGNTAGSAEVHHRDFPEIRAHGKSPTEAASHLVHQLTRALDTALTNWRRDTIQQAIADIQAFAQHGP